MSALLVVLGQVSSPSLAPRLDPFVKLWLDVGMETSHMHLSPQARRRLHATMSTSELHDLALEVADYIGHPHVDDVYEALALNGRDEHTARA